VPADHPPPSRSPRAADSDASVRDRQVLELIASGTKATSLLRAAIPKVSGHTVLQHERAVQNALSRLRVRELIVNDGDGWSLKPAGRKAAKEAP
jgi:DNA-binding CsgD family transcriptional regulator